MTEQAGGAIVSAGAAEFPGFRPEAIQFLADLAANNDRAWFQPRKARYEELLKTPLEQLCLALGDRFAARGIPLMADPKRSPFRIYRDTRFSKDKSPYKTNVGAGFAYLGRGADDQAAPRVDGRRGRNTREAAGSGPDAHGPGGYFHFQPGEMFMGGGLWGASKAQIDTFRDRVWHRPDQVRAALEDPGFVAAFGGANGHEELKRVPPGYPADHPLADLFRWKHVVFGRRLSDADVCSPNLPDVMTDAFAAALPVFAFIESLG